MGIMMLIITYKTPGSTAEVICGSDGSHLVAAETEIVKFLRYPL
jgi:hypothetical protein